jgi:hypothetical protein
MTRNSRIALADAWLDITDVDGLLHPGSMSSGRSGTRGLIEALGMTARFSEHVELDGATPPG